MPQEDQLEDDLDQEVEEVDDVIQDDPDDVDAEDQDEDADKPLGPKGEKAYEATKAKLRAERARRQAAEAKLAERDKPATDDKPDPEQAAMARVNRRVLRADIKAAATGKLADPTDALALLNLDQFEPDADGEFDEAEIAEAIDDLITRKPHLAATRSGGRRFEGGADQGARRPVDKLITEAQLKKMTPAQIAKAHEEGKLSHLM